ncbi:Starch-binding associating with outer membrane [Pedobacter steynii]|uniref:Starch-binding associating with outer membrane n=1 Tax=Pedobacter steynii TaxID=430522 RepID=A0A1G9KAS4_9SPHI|nr:RagB/SusD family nutrient uptake outer membrane protein [Pedobacter steynii]NQX38489.1 RagB/SusD family nutrient uptake outer membrane protein [Pedobacter steynii]SDL46383.1 Starch-binding associating with outer membrane [Pedobacter steynii]
MKKFIYISLISCLTLASSCKKYLDQVPNDRLTLEETFANRASAEKFLANVYNNIPDEFGQRNPGGNKNAGLWTGGSDEADFVWGFVQSNSMNIGSWDANTGFVGDFWNNYYRGIRSASFFMANVDKVSNDMSPELKVQYKAEARALRAMYYFYIMRLFGPVILLGETVTPPDAPAEEIQLPRNSFDECVTYVTTELDKAAADLPLVAVNDDSYGRITKGIALAFKAQTLLLAASPLYNGNSDLSNLKNTDGKQLVSQSVDVNKWKKAADVYKAFITQFVPGTYSLFRKNDAAGNYDPYLSCRDLFLNDWNSEVIFARVQSSIGSRQYELTPYHNGKNSDSRGSGGLGATQNQVDAFFTANGRSIDDSQSGYVNSGFATVATKYTKVGIYNQWVNREPRFYVNITYNGSTWLNTANGDITTELYNNGNSGKATGGGDYTTTGYIVRKAMGLGKWAIDNRTNILYRLANVYLDYAEALNEAEPGNTDILKYLNLIRERAGIPQYDGTGNLPVPAGQAEMREAIRKERRVELAFENVRYFDTRRWKIAEVTDNGPIYGLNITSNLPGFLNVVPFENRVFTKKHYLWPIPSKDVNVDKLLIQNPGW